MWRKTPRREIFNRASGLKKGVFLASTSAQLILILLSEAIASWKEVPASLLVHVPDVCLLTSILRLILIN